MEGREVISWIPLGTIGQQMCSRLRVGFWRLQNVIGTDSSLRPLSHKGQDGTVSNTEHWRLVKTYVQCCRGVKDGQRVHQFCQQNTYALLGWPLGRQGKGWGGFCSPKACSRVGIFQEKTTKNLTQLDLSVF